GHTLQQVELKGDHQNVQVILHTNGRANYVTESGDKGFSVILEDTQLQKGEIGVAKQNDKSPWHPEAVNIPHQKVRVTIPNLSANQYTVSVVQKNAKGPNVITHSATSSQKSQVMLAQALKPHAPDSLDPIDSDEALDSILKRFQDTPEAAAPAKSSKNNQKQTVNKAPDQLKTGKPEAEKTADTHHPHKTKQAHAKVASSKHELTRSEHAKQGAKVASSSLSAHSRDQASSPEAVSALALEANEKSHGSIKEFQITDTPDVPSSSAPKKTISKPLNALSPELSSETPSESVDIPTPRSPQVQMGYPNAETLPAPTLPNLESTQEPKPLSGTQNSFLEVLNENIRKKLAEIPGWILLTSGIALLLTSVVLGIKLIQLILTPGNSKEDRIIPQYAHLDAHLDAASPRIQQGYDHLNPESDEESYQNTASMYPKGINPMSQPNNATDFKDSAPFNASTYLMNSDVKLTDAVRQTMLLKQMNK
ncbi:MAG: hypothetical protein K2X66_12775, partial [Cyanobacteria bacterium]|nr:hypothetical protein [Cyanobacteriota bacterium]